MRIVIDTNVFVIGLIGKGNPKLIDLLTDNNFVVLFSNESYNELIEVINRPKFKKLFTSERIFRLLELLDIIKEIVEISSSTDICRDAKDNFLLDLAKDGNSDFIITEDYDLLVLNPYHNTKIVKYQQFVNQINN